MKIRKLFVCLLIGLTLSNAPAFAANPQSVLRQVREETRKIQSNNRKVARLMAKLYGTNYLSALNILSDLGDSDADGLPDLVDKKRCEANPVSTPNNPSNPTQPAERDLSGSYGGTFDLVEDNCGLSEFFIDKGYYYLGVSTNLSNHSANVSGFTTACEEKFTGSVNSNAITASYVSTMICPSGSSAEVKHSLVFNGFTADGFSSGTLTRKVSCPGFGTCNLKYAGKAIKISSLNTCR